MTTNTYSGDFIKTAVNGYDLAYQIEQETYQHSYGDNKIQPDNVGIEQHAPGIQKPQCTISGFVRRAQGGVNAHNLFAASGPTTDTEYITLMAIGANTTPVAGDLCAVYDGTLMSYERSDEMTAFQKWKATFRPRGVRIPAFPVLLLDVSQTGTATSDVYDDGAESVDTTSGGVAILEVLTPTGTAASLTCGTAAQPANGNAYAFGIDGTTYVYTWTTAATPSASTIIVGSDAADSAKNLWYALVGDPSQSGVKYGASVTALPSAKVYPSTPTAADVITLTAVATGTAANAWTAISTGANLNVSSTAFGSGAAGETATVVVQTATTSGGSYATVATFTLNMQTRGAQVITIPVGTTISRYVKAVVTMSAATMTWAARIAFGRWWSNQA